MTLQDGIIFLHNLGMFDVVLPFILIFTITYAVLEKIKMFGEASTHQIHAMISLVLGFIFVAVESYVGFLNNTLALIALLFVGILGVVLVGGLFGIKQIPSKYSIPGAFVVLLLIMLAAANKIQTVSSFFQTLPWLAIMATIVAIGLVYYITKSEKKQDQAQSQTDQKSAQKQKGQ